MKIIYEDRVQEDIDNLNKIIDNIIDKWNSKILDCMNYMDAKACIANMHNELKPYRKQLDEILTWAMPKQIIIEKGNNNE